MTGSREANERRPEEAESGCLRRILITGGIGSGKSVVARICRLKGFPVFDTDRAALALIRRETEVGEALTARWGSRVFDSEGVYNRKMVAAIVFADHAERLWLNSLIHNRVREQFRQMRPGRGGLLFVETALPTSSHIADDCDRIWLVEASLDVRLARLRSRNPDMPSEEAMRRISAQDEEYQALPAQKVDTLLNDPDSSLLPTIDNLLKTL